MTPAQVHVLGKCVFEDELFPGYSSNLVVNSGHQRQINWLHTHGLIYNRGGRWRANASGRRVYNYQKGYPLNRRHTRCI